jgi:hypothetical protein
VFLFNLGDLFHDATKKEWVWLVLFLTWRQQHVVP